MNSRLGLLRIRVALYRLVFLLMVVVVVVVWLSGIYFAIDYSYYQARGEYYPVNLWLTNSSCLTTPNGTLNLIETYP